MNEIVVRGQLLVLGVHIMGICMDRLEESKIVVVMKTSSQESVQEICGKKLSKWNFLRPME